MTFLKNLRAMSNVLIFALVLASVYLPPSFSQDADLTQKGVANLDAETLTKILDNYRGKPYENFTGFALDVYITGKRFFNREQHNAIGDFAANKRLSPREGFIVHRLLGVYTRLKYGGEARRMLEKLVSIPSYRKEGVPQHRNAHFIRLEKVIARYAREFGLKYKNIGGRVYEVSLPSKGGVLVGLHAHGDVVPANPDLWILPDGTKLSPFKMTQVGNKLYGRGTQDDKNAIVAAMMAMRTIKEEKIRLFNGFKLLIDTTEETSSDAIAYYFERRRQPHYNIALGGSYPVVIAEKGSGAVIARFPVMDRYDGGNEIVKLTGGLAINQIPEASRATITTKQPQYLEAKLNELGAEFAAKHGANFKVIARARPDGVVLDVIGQSAHSSAPASGLNPVSRMLLFIKNISDAHLVNKNHITSAAAYFADNWGLDYYGTKLGIDFEHHFMGALTATPTQLTLDKENFEIAINLRIPAGKPISLIESQIVNQLNLWRAKYSPQAEFKFKAVDAMYRDPEGRWLNAMLDVASENLDLPREFGSSSGGTSVHFLPNGVQFGLARPEEKYTGHNANEYKTIDQFLLDLQIVTEMIMRIGLMRNLD